MAQRRPAGWAQLKVGLLVILAFAMLSYAVVRIGGPTSLFGKKITVTAYFPNANGLRNGAEVNLDGILVGNVESVGITSAPGAPGKVAVVMKIEEAYKDRIRTDSEIGIDTIGLLGDKNIQLSSGTEKGTPIPDGGMMIGTEVGDIRRIITGTDDLLINLKVLSDKVINISDSVDRGEGTLGKLLTNSEIHDNLNKVVLEMEQLVRDIRSGPGTAGKLINDDTMYERVVSTLSRIDNVVAKVERGEGTAGKLLNDTALYDKADQLLARMDSIASRIDSGEGSMGKMIRDDALYNDMRATMRRVDSLISAIENGDGTAGRLIKDPSLYNTLNQTTSEIQKLLYDIKQDPKKYLTINFRLF
jgi:phospholipid/cholesterol/gamma-HCH transport system substrate-binding protein